MATRQERFSLRLQLERQGLPLEFFTHTSTDLRTLLHIIEESRSGQRSHAEWSVDTDQIHVTASVNGVSAEELQDIVSDAYEGFRVGDAEGEDWPPTLATEAQQIIKRIVRRVKNTAPARLEAVGHNTLFIEPKERFRISPPREVYSAWSSIDGKLDVISVRRVPYFVIFEHVTEHRVRCLFPDDWLGIVKNYLGLRVIAEGFIHYRSDGVPTTLTNPTSLERVPDPEQADITTYRGTMPGITGGLSSYEYVRQMREGKDE
ncbi:MAG: hypothetical protein HYU29_04050 [Chloroflexi bacterium]|nr:hypothetical protein [Chloroflexota bacterium]